MQRLSEEIVLLAATAPATVNSTPGVSAWVDASQMHELLAVFQTGDMAAETIDFKIEQATDGSGTGVKDLKAATQLAAHASNNDGKQVFITATADKIDSQNGFRYVRTRAVTGNTTGGIVAQQLWGRPTYKPAAHNASVVQTAVA